MVTTYDTMSYELAKHFLQDDDHYKAASEEQKEAMAHDLALHIQDAVETWFEQEDRSK